MADDAGEPSVEDVGDLFDRYADRVAAWASRLGGPLLDVEDVVQEVFIIAYRSISSFRREARPRTWLYGITANVVHQQRRKARRRRWFGIGQVDDLPQPTQPTPIETLEQRRRTLAVYRVLDAMREHHRTVLILFEVEELSGEEIAELTEVRVATVWVRLHRAREEFGRLARRMIPDDVRDIEERLERMRRR